MRTGFVYALCHPGTGEVRYVGMSVDPKKRLWEHVRAARKRTSHSQCWLLSLDANPRLLILDSAPCDELATLERKHIATMRALGIRLTNLTAGGDGVCEPSSETRERKREAALRQWETRTRKHSPETLEKIRAATRTPEARAYMRAAHLGRKQPPAVTAKIAAANRGRKRSPESVAKTAAANRGKKRSPESRARMSAAQKGSTVSPETRAKISAAQRGRPGKPHTPETKAKLSALTKGRKATPETRAKISAGNRRWWANHREAQKNDA